MKLIKKFIIFKLVCIFSSGIAFTQSTTNVSKNGSSYSYLGIGSPVPLSSAQELGMGIIGVSFADVSTSGLSNPAFWGIGFLSRASTNFNFSHFSASDATSSSTNTLLSANQIHLVLPIKNNKLGISAALYPTTRSNYQVFTGVEVFPSATDTVVYFLDKNGSGGINKLELGLGWRINNSISIGYAPSFTFLSSTDNENVSFIGNEFEDNSVIQQFNGSGLSHRFGLLLRARSFLRKSDLIQFGATATLSNPFTVESSRSVVKYVEGVQQNDKIGADIKNEVSLPNEFSAGISYFPSNTLNFSAEAMMQYWGDAKYGFSAEEENTYTDRLFLGFGGQYHPYTTGSSKFLSKFKYSYGISYDTGHLNIQGEDISTLWFSTGLGILSPRARSSFDLSFQYGIRNVTSSSLIDERIWSISLSVNLAELMFIRPKLN